MNKVFKLNQFIKVLSKTTTQPVNPPAEENNTTKELSELMTFLKQTLAAGNNTAIVTSTQAEDNKMSDEQCGEIIDCLEEYHERFFPDLPLSGQLVKKFIYNLPVEIWNQHVVAYERMEYGLDPLMLLYPFCMESPEDTFGKYMITLAEVIKKEESYIKEDADAYDAAVSEASGGEENENS